MANKLTFLELVGQKGGTMEIRHVLFSGLWDWLHYIIVFICKIYAFDDIVVVIVIVYIFYYEKM